jgi:PAS domain S-box-containing protein
MGALLRMFDWAATPLGALDTWPSALRTTVSIMLGSRHPMYIAWGPGLHFLFNDAYRPILGALGDQPDHILGKPFNEVWSDLWHEVGPMLNGAMAGTCTAAEDHPFVVHRHGYPEQMYATFSVSPVRDETGAVAGVFCVCAETTGKVVARQERDRALTELAASNEKLRIAAEATGFGLIDFQLQRDELVCSDLALQHFGLPRGADVRAQLSDRMHPDDRDRVLSGMRTLIDTARAARYQDEYRTVGLDDGRERWISAQGQLLLDADGTALRLVGTTLDITRQKRVEGRLRLLDTIGKATSIASDAKSIMAEATRLLGEHLGVTRVAYADLEADNDRFTIRHDWTVPGTFSTVGVYSLDLFGSRATGNLRVGKTLQINNVDTELAAGDGVEMFNQIGIKAIICCPLVKGGKLVAMMAVHQQHPRAWSADEVALVEDVVERCWAHIERVRSTEALREADRHKSEFLATLAHELRNPLAPVRNGLEIMKLAAGDPAAMASVRAMMERQVSHMVHLINDLLDIARVSSGKLVLKKEYAELKTLVASAVETSQPLLDAAGQTLTVRLPEAAAIVEVDVVRISQVLSNLLSNAAKYTPADGHIDITARVTDRQLLIEVADDGIGIAPESIESVFEMFTQVGRSIANAKGGLGIGLSLVRRLVELHGGTVSAASAGIGRGSTFTVCLPLAALDGASLPPTPSTAVEPSPATRLRVLITDDNRDAADTLSDLLLNDGHDTRVAYDGAGALAVAAEFRPDVVLLDIGMPGMDGYETARAMRRLPGLEHVTLAALTGWGAAEDRARSRAAGFDHHLLKPIVLAELQALLRQPTSPSAG